MNSSATDSSSTGNTTERQANPSFCEGERVLVRHGAREPDARTSTGRRCRSLPRSGLVQYAQVAQISDLGRDGDQVVMVEFSLESAVSPATSG
jgi:hypothetical protein